MRGKWIDPAGGRVLLRTYAERWMADRLDLSNRTREKYAGLLKLHILPAFGHREMGLIEPVAERGWWAKLAQTRPSTAANAYRRDPGSAPTGPRRAAAGRGRASGRRVPERRDRRLQEPEDGARSPSLPTPSPTSLPTWPPTLPTTATPWCSPEPRVGPLRPHVLAMHWRAATEAAGLVGFHFHDLRHTSNTWAAATGASTRELMATMGHASPVAAIGYQHATADRDRVIADALAGLAAQPAGAEIVPIDGVPG